MAKPMFNENFKRDAVYRGAVRTYQGSEPSFGSL